MAHLIVHLTDAHLDAESAAFVCAKARHRRKSAAATTCSSAATASAEPGSISPPERRTQAESSRRRSPPPTPDARTSAVVQVPRPIPNAKKGGSASTGRCGFATESSPISRAPMAAASPTIWPCRWRTSSATRCWQPRGCRRACRAQSTDAPASSPGEAKHHRRIGEVEISPPGAACGLARAARGVAWAE